MATREEFIKSIEFVITGSKAAMQAIALATKLEQQRRFMRAISTYEMGLNLIKATLSLPVALPDDKGCILNELEQLRVMFKGLIEKRVYARRNIKKISWRHVPINFKQHKKIANDLREILADRNIPASFTTLCRVNIDFYKVQPTGEIHLIGKDLSMSLMKCTVGGKWSYLNGARFIQCEMIEKANEQASSSQYGDMVWIYPIIRNVTVLLSVNISNLYFPIHVFPDYEDVAVGSSFCIIVNQDGMDNATFHPIFRNMLDHINRVTNNDFFHIRSISEVALKRIENKIGITGECFTHLGTFYFILHKCAAFLDNYLREISSGEHTPPVSCIAAGTLNTLGTAFIINRNVNNILPIPRDPVVVTELAKYREYYEWFVREHHVAAGQLFENETDANEGNNEKIQKDGDEDADVDNANDANEGNNEKIQIDEDEDADVDNAN